MIIIGITATTAIGAPTGTARGTMAATAMAATGMLMVVTAKVDMAEVVMAEMKVAATGQIPTSETAISTVMVRNGPGSPIPATRCLE